MKMTRFMVGTRMDRCIANPFSGILVLRRHLPRSGRRLFWSIYTICEKSFWRLISTYKTSDSSVREKYNQDSL